MSTSRSRSQEHVESKRARAFRERRSSRRRTSQAIAWAVTALAATASLLLIRNFMQSGNAPIPRGPASSIESDQPTNVNSSAPHGLESMGSTTFSELKADWKILADAWHAEREVANRASSTGSYWTDRDDDAYRILRTVASGLETLRRREAREEKVLVRLSLERLNGDRKEWQKLVVEVPQKMPDRD